MFGSNLFLSYIRNSTTALVFGGLCATSLFAAPLNFSQFFGDNSNGTNHISSLFGTAASPDGKSVYTISFVENTISTFSRDATTNLLNYSSEIIEDPARKIGVHQPNSILISPDNKFVYVTGMQPDSTNNSTTRAIGVFKRDEVTGALTQIQTYTGRGLGDPAYMTISSDSAYIYVAGTNSSAITVLKRAANGVLSEEQYFTDLVGAPLPSTTNSSVENSFIISPDQKNIYLALRHNTPVYGTIIAHYSRDLITGHIGYMDQIDYTRTGLSGFDNTLTTNISPDGKFLYATTGGSAPEGEIVIFAVSNTGTLSLSHRYTLNDSNQTLQQFYWPNDIQFSGNGKLAYVSDNVTDALFVFNRNNITGALTFLGAEKNNKDGVIDLREPYSVTLSPDGLSAYVGTAWGLTVFDLYSDLVISSTPNSTTIPLGGAFKLDVSVINNAGATAHNTTMSVAIPTGVSLSSIKTVSPSTQCSTSNNTVICTLGSLTKTGAESVEINLIAPVNAGQLIFNTSVSADEVDSNTANNSSLTTIMVSSSAAQSSGTTSNSNSGSASNSESKRGGGGSFDWWLTVGLVTLIPLTRRRCRQ